MNLRKRGFLFSKMEAEQGAIPGLKEPNAKATGFDDPKLAEEMKELERYVPKMLDWLHKNSRSSLKGWKLSGGKVQKIQSSDFGDTFCALADFQTEDRSGESGKSLAFWGIEVLSPVGEDSVMVRVKKPYYQARVERTLLPKKYLVDPGTLFETAGITPAMPRYGRGSRGRR